MKNQLAHRTYLDSIEYKMIYVLAGYRRIANITKEQIAKNIGVTPSLISQIELGHKAASNEVLISYIKIIADSFQYNSDAFHEALRSQVDKLSINESQVKANISFIRCIKGITSVLLKQTRQKLKVDSSIN